MLLPGILRDKRTLSLPFQRGFRAADQGHELHRSKMFGPILLEIRRLRDSLLKKSQSEGNMQKEITDFFKTQSHPSDKKDPSQFAGLISNTKGILINRAVDEWCTHIYMYVCMYVYVYIHTL